MAVRGREEERKVREGGGVEGLEDGGAVRTTLLTSLRSGRVKSVLGGVFCRGREVTVAIVTQVKHDLYHHKHTHTQTTLTRTHK